MAKVLTIASTVVCGHAGKVATTSTTKLTVAQAPVLTPASIAGKSIGGCTTVPPPQSNKPCLAVTGVTAGQATKLTVGNEPVILDDTLAGTTDGVSGVTPPHLSATAGQAKLTAI
jgi:hypothetical protein